MGTVGVVLSSEVNQDHVLTCNVVVARDTIEESLSLVELEIVAE